MRLTARVAMFALVLASPLFADWPAEKSAFEGAYSAESPEARLAAVKALHDFDHPEGMALLLAVYATEKDFDVRHALADAMNAIANVRARDVFRDTILKHPEAETRVRFCALFADGRMFDRFEMLRFLLRDPSELVRARALRNLGDSDGALVADASKLVDDAAADVRMAACGALGVVKSAEAGPALIRVLENEKLAEIRWAAGDALGKISGEMNGEDLAAWKKWWSDKRLAAMGPVEKALWRGGEFLKTRMATLMDAYQNAPGPAPGDRTTRIMNVRGITLVIYAMIHAGVPLDDPVMKVGIEILEKMPINSTYDISLCAMALADVDAAGHRERLAEIAQWLCDSQCANGQWGYGSWPGQVADPSKPVPEKKTESPSPKTGGETGAEPAKIRIAWRNHQRPPTGDNSNTQYALLGLRACLAAADIPKPVWQLSLSFFRKTQSNDGSWGYGPGVQPGYGSMTVGGIAAVVICMRALGMDDELQPAKLKAHKEIRAALDWIGTQFSVEANPVRRFYTYYWLYGLERAGMIVGVAEFGKHDWYKEGSEVLLKAQQDDGSWKCAADAGSEQDNDTCFAILFLRKATRGYTVSGQGK